MNQTGEKSEPEPFPRKFFILTCYLKKKLRFVSQLCGAEKIDIFSYVYLTGIINCLPCEESTVLVLRVI